MTEDPVAAVGGASEALLVLVHDWKRAGFIAAQAKAAAEGEIQLAEAQARAAIVKADAEVIVKRIEALARQEALADETRYFLNRRAIVNAAVAHLEGAPAPNAKMEADWFNEFSEQCKNVSDEKMGSVWARILAGEFQQPGSFSLRTLDFVRTMRAEDAEAFTRVCSYAVHVDPPGTYIVSSKYSRYSTVDGGTVGSDSVNPKDRRRLREIGLLSHVDAWNAIVAEETASSPTLRNRMIRYFEFSHVPVEDEMGFRYQTGDEFTRVGSELARIAGADMDRDFGIRMMRSLSQVRSGPETMRSRWEGPTS